MNRSVFSLSVFVLLSVVAPAQEPATTRRALLADWLAQDSGGASLFTSQENADAWVRVLNRVLSADGMDGSGVRATMKELLARRVVGQDRRWVQVYVAACRERRALRLAPLLAKCKQVVFTKHFNMGGSHYAYTEAQSDAQAETNYIPGGALCILDVDDGFGSVTMVRQTAEGVIRDPDVSFDGKRILFAQKNSEKGDDYHLYEMDLQSGTTNQVTDGKGVADYEGIYLPDGGIAFASTRCVQSVPCWWTEVSNLYRVMPDGSDLRRLNVDQVHTTYPQLLTDGRISYTRWEYSDRGQIFPQPLFLMNSDGTKQAELYGNSSWFPTTILHARPLPGSHELVCILAGHHTYQTGKLAILDVKKGRQENQGVQLIAPVRETPAVRIDAYGQEGELFQYPYAVTRRHFLVGYHPGGDRVQAKFGIYLIDLDGNRELLVSDARISCNQPVPLMERAKPPVSHDVLADASEGGVYRCGNVYVGPGSKGIPKGLAKRLRIVALDFRPIGIGRNEAHGPAGMAIVSTPIAIGDGSWDVKEILGSVPLEADGSASFEVPSETPLYFQLLDENDHVIQTMRSWTMVQPGETYTCIGCHARAEDLPDGPPKMPIAFTRPPRKIEPFYGPPRGFSYPKEIQPILDAKCVSCHFERPAELVMKELWKGGNGAQTLSAAEGEWSWTTEQPGDGWEGVSFDDAAWRKGRGGFGRKGTPGGRVRTNWTTSDIWMRRTFTMDTLPEDAVFGLRICHDEDAVVFLNGAQIAHVKGYITGFRTIIVTDDVRDALRPGENHLAVHCHQTTGGQFIDLSLIAAKRPSQVAPDTAADGVLPAFSLTGAAVLDEGAKRRWSESYLTLTASREMRDFMHGTSGKLVNWISAQSVPDAISFYHKGAARSGLMKMLDGSHYSVVLTKEEKDKIACWIDLLVPFCGDYTENNAWSEREQETFQRFMEKRRKFSR